MNAVIETQRLTKSYGPHRGIIDVDLTVNEGEAFGFLGPNGAGKTTTIFAMLGLLRPDRGRVRLFGHPAGSLEARRRTGFQSEIFFTYPFKTAEAALDFYGALSEMPDPDLSQAVSRQLERLGLAGARARKVRGFSKGMTQRLGLAQALLHQPDLLVLDEPTTGLDPEGRKLVAEIIREEKARGATVFLSSHILSDVERTCDQVVILNQGSVVFAESMDRVRRDADDWEIEVEGADGPSIVRCKTPDKDALLLRLLTEGASIGGVRRAHSLEDLYMKYAGGSSSG